MKETDVEDLHHRIWALVFSERSDLLFALLGAQRTNPDPAILRSWNQALRQIEGAE